VNTNNDNNNKDNNNISIQQLEPVYTRFIRIYVVVGANILF